jgi:hypothetical protein
MMTSLLFIGLSVLISIIVRAYALPIVLRIVAIRNWLYVVITSEEGKEHREEILANVHDEIKDYRSAGDSNDAIAAKIFLRVVTGLPGDIARCWPYIPALLVDNIGRWSDILRHHRISNAMVASVATLGLMNYSLFSSQDNQTLTTWLVSNGIVAALLVLVWKRKHPIARRILYSWMGIAVVTLMGFMVWLTIDYRLYELMTFRIFMLAMIAMIPAIFVVDKSWRNRLFKGRWWLIVLCWALIVAGALAGSWVMAHNVIPLLETWAAMAMLAVGLLIGFGALTSAAAAVCWLGIRGSSGWLRLVASGIRRLR